MKFIKVLIVVSVFSVLCAFFSEAFFTEKNELVPPVRVEDSENDQTIEKLKDYSEFACSTPIVNAIDVSAGSAILCTADGTVIYEKNADVTLPMASITKVMSAIVALECAVDISEEIRVPKEAVGIEGSSVYLTNGETVTVEMLLYSAMLESANDAVTALAIATAGTLEAFVDKMNEKATELSMLSTHFCNPHGLHENGHFTTARDYAKLMSYALENEAFCKIIATKKAVFPKSDGTMTRVMTNHNRLLNTYSGMLGGKTGYTKASGRTLVTAARRNATTLICVTIDAPNDWQDHSKMLDVGFDAVKTVTFNKELDTEVPVATGVTDKVTAVLSEAVSFTVGKNETVTYAVKVPHLIFAPVIKGEVIGTAEFYKDGKKLGQVSLIAEEGVEAAEPRQEKEGFLGKLLGIFR